MCWNVIGECSIVCTLGQITGVSVVVHGCVVVRRGYVGFCWFYLPPMVGGTSVTAGSCLSTVHIYRQVTLLSNKHKWASCSQEHLNTEQSCTLHHHDPNKHYRNHKLGFCNSPKLLCKLAFLAASKSLYHISLDIYTYSYTKIFSREAE